MSAWDYIMPHRLLLNKSLRKASQELRDRIESYQIEFDRRLEDCKAELQQAEENKNKELEELRVALLQELSDDHQALEEIQETIFQYIDCYFYHAYLTQRIEINKKKNDILHEDYTFLSSEMDFIDKEIILLRKRQNELTAFTKVDDIIQLAALSEYNLDFQSTDDARQLLRKISGALETYSGENRAEKFALLRLKTIIQERSDYLPTINYISWIIQIKLRFKKQLLSKRSDVQREQAVLNQETTSIKREILTLTDRLDMLAKRVRNYWAKPITYLNADICYAYVELKEKRTRLRNDVPALRSQCKELIDKKRSAISEVRVKKSRRRDVGNELRNMSDSHSSDQWKWDSLQSERSSLTSDIDRLSSDIDSYSSRIDSLNSEIDFLESAVKSLEATISSKKVARKKWNTKRVQIVEFMKRYDKNFPSNKRIADEDELNIISTRLEAIQKIREEGAVEAQEECKREYEKSIQVHKEKVRSFEIRRQELQTEFKKTATVCSECEQRVASAEKRLKLSEEKDGRFIFVRLLTVSPTVTAAKEEIENARRALIKAQTAKRSVKLKIEELEEESEAEANEFNETINNYKPRYLRPTGAELREEKKLLLRREDIKKQRGGGHEGKN